MPPQINSTILLKPFVDDDSDSIGWYALGHHKPKEFLAAVSQQHNQALFSKAQVQLTWARMEGDSIFITNEPLTNPQPITVVETAFFPTFDNDETKAIVLLTYSALTSAKPTFQQTFLRMKEALSGLICLFSS